MSSVSTFLHILHKLRGINGAFAKNRSVFSMKSKINLLSETIFTIYVFVNDCSHTSSHEIAVANSYFVNAGLVFLSFACNNCHHFCFKVLKTDTSSGWKRSVVCSGNFKVVTFLNIAELENQHVRDDHHISLTFLQALHWMYRNVPFFPIP